MAYLIGTDEAGYGPNFGPLIVSATVWQVPDELTHAGFYAAVNNCVTSYPLHRKRSKAEKQAKKKNVARKTVAKKKVVKGKSSSRRIDPRVWIADSKQLYKPGSGLAALERGVMAAIISSGNALPCDWHTLWETICGDDHASMKQLPWYVSFDERLPVDVTDEEAKLAAEQLTAGLADANIRLCRIRSRAIDARQFNELLCKYGNKSEVLSHVTLGLVSDQIDWIRNVDCRAEPMPIRVLCDKHGGRNHYAALLSHCFPDLFVEVYQESRPVSRYAFGPSDARIEFAFQAKADNILAAGLASMTAKYLRELAMRAFNEFWCGHDAELKPTAGYPSDARRFKQQIDSVQADLGIADQILWRER